MDRSEKADFRSRVFVYFIYSREAFGYEGDLNPKFGYEGFRSDMGEIQAVRYSDIGGFCLDMGGISLLEIRL